MKVNKIKYFLIFFAIIFLANFSAAEAAPKRILLVPGHDASSVGAQFRSLTEADMNLKLAEYIATLFRKDKNYEVFITRDWNGYTPVFANYFVTQEQHILDYIWNARLKFNQDVDDGKIIRKENPERPNAPFQMIKKLYGINLWANENNIDAVIHIHFNDYERKQFWNRGIYRGFTMYVPEEQLLGASESRVLSAHLFNEIRQYYPVSNETTEAAGMVFDQELIALGANNSIAIPRTLIEYSYIYELKFSTYAKRQTEYKRMANLTYQGIKNYFNSKK